MAKRGAEALACRAPCQSWLSRAPLPKRPRSDFERRGPRCAALRHQGGVGKKREEEEEEEEGEAAAVPSGKRPAAWKGPARKQGRRAPSPSRREGATRPLQLTGVDVEAEAEGAKDRRTPQRLAQHEDDVWHYNSFQFWRSPLPIIDLTDILDLEKIDTVEARDSSSVGLSEMET